VLLINELSGRLKDGCVLFRMTNTAFVCHMCEPNTRYGRFSRFNNHITNDHNCQAIRGDEGIVLVPATKYVKRLAAVVRARETERKRRSYIKKIDRYPQKLVRDELRKISRLKMTQEELRVQLCEAQRERSRLEMEVQQRERERHDLLQARGRVKQAVMAQTTRGISNSVVGAQYDHQVERGQGSAVVARFLLTLMGLSIVAGMQLANGQVIESSCDPYAEFYDAVIESCQKCEDVCRACNTVCVRDCLVFCYRNCKQYFELHCWENGNGTNETFVAMNWEVVDADTVTSYQLRNEEFETEELERTRLLTNPSFWVSVTLLIVAFVATVITVLILLCHDRRPERIQQVVV
jgi:hypothetical protein